MKLLIISMVWTVGSALLLIPLAFLEARTKNKPDDELFIGAALWPVVLIISPFALLPYGVFWLLGWLYGKLVLAFTPKPKEPKEPKDAQHYRDGGEE